MPGVARLGPRSVALVAALAFAAVATSAPARADAPPAHADDLARRAFEEGVTLEKRGDFAAALDRFRESLAYKATLGNRFHAAFCLESLGRLAAALDEYETVEALAKAGSKADMLATTRARLEPLRTRVPKLAIRVVVTDAAAKQVTPQVTLDDAELAARFLDGTPFRADPGEHTIVARAADHDDAVRRLTLAEGSSTEVALVLERSRPKPPPPPTPAPAAAAGPDKERAEPRSRAAAIGVTAGAVASLAAGFVTFALAGSAQSDAEASCPARRSCDDERATVRTFDALALGGFVAAAALGALAVVLWTRTPSPPATAGAPRVPFGVSF